MQPNIFKINHNSLDIDLIDKAVTLVRKGEIIAFPTDTVYGVGGDIFNSKAIEKLFLLKKQSRKKPINALVSNLEQFESIVESIPDEVRDIIKKFWPGPLTIILRKKESVSDIVTSGLSTIGVRMPDNRIALEIINRNGKPLATTSANISDKRSSFTAEEVYSSFEDKISMIIDSQEKALGIESTIITFATPTPQILRPGAISQEELAKFIAF